MGPALEVGPGDGWPDGPAPGLCSWWLSETSRTSWTGGCRAPGLPARAQDPPDHDARTRDRDRQERAAEQPQRAIENRLRLHPRVERERHAAQPIAPAAAPTPGCCRGSDCRGCVLWYRILLGRCRRNATSSRAGPARHCPAPCPPPDRPSAGRRTGCRLRSKLVRRPRERRAPRRACGRRRRRAARERSGGRCAATG